MAITPVLLGAAASTMTMTGGWLALRWRHQLMLALGLAAGVVLGVALFDLLPEAVELGAGAMGMRALCAAVAAGLAGYLLLDRTLGGLAQQTATWRAHLGPATLTLHSLLDGLGIGLAFQAGEQVGWVVAAAVLTHDLADGLNTVSLSLAVRPERTARRWLLANGAAPLIGVLLGLHVRLAAAPLALLLAAFAGAFLYIGAGELLARSHRLDPRLRTTAATVTGMALMAMVTSLIG